MTRNASDRMSEILKTTIAPSLAKESISDFDGPRKKFSNQFNDRIDNKRLSNCLISAMRSAIDFEESRIGCEPDVTDESIIRDESKVSGASIQSLSSLN